MNKQFQIRVQGEIFTLHRELLLRQTQNKQFQQNKEAFLPMPQWVTKQVYLLIVEYLQQQNVMFLQQYLHDNMLVIKLLRASDYLGLNQFQDKIINQLLVENIRFDNCLVLLEESHKKLKSMENSQSWFKLLNQGISYLSKNLFELYKSNPQKLKNLNEKILNQVLDIVIRQQRKTGFPNQHILYQLIFQCKNKNMKSSQTICRHLRSALQHKKIVSKIHAKLSWKLEKMQQIHNKKTKVFKFLDYRWFLSADRSSEGLLVTLNLVPYQNISDTNSVISTTSKAETYLGVQSQVGDKPIDESVRNDKYTKIGVFYSKVISKTEDYQSEKELKIFYMPLSAQCSIPIINFSNNIQHEIGPKKVELTIFFNIDLIYTFVNNYVLFNFEGLQLNTKQLCREQLLNMIQVAKSINQSIKAMQLTSQYLVTYPDRSQEQLNKLFAGYNFNSMTKLELEIYENLLKGRSSQFNKKILHRQSDGEHNQNHKNLIMKKSGERSPIIYDKSGSHQKKKDHSIKGVPKGVLAITPIDSVVKKTNINAWSNNSKEKIVTTAERSNPQKFPIHLYPETFNNMFEDSSSIYINSSMKNDQKEINLQKKNITENSIKISHQQRPNILQDSNSCFNSLNNSRNNSKRKIFNKTSSVTDGSNENYDKRPAKSKSVVNTDELMEEMLKVTNLANYLRPTCNPQVAQSIHQIYK